MDTVWQLFSSGSKQNDVQKILLCMLCTQTLDEKWRLLDCGHITCTSCLTEYSKVQFTESIKISEGDESETQLQHKPSTQLLHCPICGACSSLKVGTNIKALPNKAPKLHLVNAVKYNLALVNVKVPYTTTPTNELSETFTRIDTVVSTFPQHIDKTGNTRITSQSLTNENLSSMVGVKCSYLKQQTDNSPLKLDLPCAENINVNSDKSLNPDCIDSGIEITLGTENISDLECSNAERTLKSVNLSKSKDTLKSDNVTRIPPGNSDSIDDAGTLSTEQFGNKNTLHCAYKTTSESTFDSGIETNLSSSALVGSMIKDSGNRTSHLGTHSFSAFNRHNSEGNTSSFAISNQTSECFPQNVPNIGLPFHSPLDQIKSIGKTNTWVYPQADTEVLKSFRFNQHEILQLCCKLHKNKECKYHCDTCNIPICKDCIEKNHQSHQLIETDLVLPEWQDQLLRIKTSMDEHIQEIRLYEAELQYCYDQQRSNYEKVKHGIERQFDFIHKEINKQKINMIQKLKTHMQSSCQTHLAGSKLLQYNSKYTHKLHQLCRIISADKENHQAKMSLNYKCLNSRVNTLLHEKDKYEAIISSLKQSLSFYPNTKFIKHMNTGTIERNEIKIPKLLVNKVSQKGNFTCIQDTPQLLWQENPKPYQTNPVPYGAIYLKDDSLLVAYEKTGITKYKAGNSGNTDIHFNVTDNHRKILPRCMTLVDHNMFAVTDARYMTVRYYNTNGINKKMLSQEIFRCQIKSSQTLPFGIVSLCNGKLAVSDSSHNVVYILDPERETIISQFGGTNEEKTKQLNTPEFLYFDEIHNRILVTDRNNHCIKLFDINGSFISQFGHPSNYTKPLQFSDGRCTNEFRGLKEPGQAICINNGNILVANAGRHNICEFNREGDMLSIVKLYDQDGDKEVQLSWPRGMALGATGQVAITEACWGSVKVFQMYNDKFVQADK